MPTKIIKGRSGVEWTRHCSSIKIPSAKHLLLNGYWIWWCKEHDQPSAWCEVGRLQDELASAIRSLREQLEAAKKEIARYADKALMANNDKLRAEQALEAERKRFLEMEVHFQQHLDDNEGTEEKLYQAEKALSEAREREAELVQAIHECNRAPGGCLAASDIAPPENIAKEK